MKWKYVATPIVISSSEMKNPKPVGPFVMKRYREWMKRSIEAFDLRRERELEERMFS